MKLFKKSIKIKEKKSVLNYTNFLHYGGYSASTLNGNSNSFLHYYNTVAPVQTAIDVIAKETAKIDIKIYDNKNQEWVTEHPFLSILNTPNPYQTKYQFISQLIKFYVLTGNSYTFLSGDITREPLELYNYNPNNIVVQKNCQDGFPDYYQYQNSGNTTNYNRIPNLRGRYGNVRGELIHLKNFSCLSENEFIQGSSFLQSLEEQIQFFEKLCLNNRGFLENGMRLSGILGIKGESIDDEGMQQIQQGLKSSYQGSNNAGKVMAINVDDIKFQELSQKSKGMDFYDLYIDASTKIYQKLGIPLDFIQGNSTFNNKENAKYELYDNCILSFTKDLFSFLTNAILKTRYKDSENLSLKIDISTIEVLQQRNTYNVINLYEKGLITLNEGRQHIGREALEGGDNIGMATDLYTADNRDKPAKKSISPSLRKTLESFGYTELEIKSIVDND